jgi:hypothetical protein
MPDQFMAAIARTVSPGVRVNVEALNIVVVCGVALAASLLLFIWSAHLGPASTVELGIMNWLARSSSPRVCPPYIPLAGVTEARAPSTGVSAKRGRLRKARQNIEIQMIPRLRGPGAAAIHAG